MSDREILATYRKVAPGTREVVDWDRDDKTYYNVPVVWLRETTAEAYYKQFPHMRGRLQPESVFFYEVSVD